ncbi:DNA polymerase III subunit beta [Fuchsiella alkaliacetigena]|uniref:DNA polymerase III subunit beta n=1 Tax=Fuchsiella alkaliacetigena TaxID=957042 RepID=UPI00200A68C3|nr:DNA polymerase III subunit beta [Fuchsiella alkaliacetigena]MCK8824526.1 DNA polymerase III subunit beta [Fuchsiella alkaliacetigena]
MEIKINQKEFYNGIQTVRKAVSTNNALPILSGILIKTEKDKLKLVATDLELGIECTVEANILEKGAVVLPATYLANIIRELPKEKLKLKVNSNNNTKIEFKRSQFKINGSPADEFPLLPEIESGINYTLSSAFFKDMINRTKFATSQDESRPFLTGGLLLIENNELKMIATDSYRLAYSNSRLDKEFKNSEVIIPSKTLEELSKLLTSEEEEEIKVVITENQILFNFLNITLISRLIEGQFPSYQQVLPDSSKTEVEIDKNQLLNATKRASLLAKDNSNIIKVELKDNFLIIKSNSPEVGESYEQIKVDQKGENTEIAFNASYLIDVLKVIEEEKVLMNLSGSLNPGVIKEIDNNDYIYIIMPVRSA